MHYELCIVNYALCIMNYAFLTHPLHHTINRPDLEAFGCIDVRQFDFVQAECAAADLTIKMRVEVVVFTIVSIIIAVPVAVADFVTDAARAILDYVYKMMLSK